MNIREAIEQRHSVRQYTGEPLSERERAILQGEIDFCNAESGLRFQLICDSPDAFSGMKARMAKFKNADNYIALVGPKGDKSKGMKFADIQTVAGYYGQHLVLIAQMIGLNTCWVGASFDKNKVPCAIGDDEKLIAVIVVGHGANQGKPHKSMPLDEFIIEKTATPRWFVEGVRYATMAPTAMNLQLWGIACIDEGDEETLPVVNIGATGAKWTGVKYDKIDLGIVRYTFEAAVGAKNFKWQKDLFHAEAYVEEVHHPNEFKGTKS